MAKADNKSPVVFRDTEYKCRTIILPDGTEHRVLHSHITAASPELVSYLDASSEFERVPVTRVAA
ncbi:hypothetical protein [Massilia sp. erpn]|uniref:hypothetical protein n=1 Tax=Massilia sp. erpn TaxID=2738142 RepID=UPI0021080367|nr:hypothetical protein [Massilia sp. erpn]UTY60414.1 hypothetical protein HPQ68_26400 [Massilia sp. erpn]